MRQFACVELTLTDALMLRDAVRPQARSEPFEPGSVVRFCEKLYDSLLKMKIEGIEAINVPLEEQEALIINQSVTNEDWQGALPLLEQTWLVLYELRHERAYPRIFAVPSASPSPAAEPSTTAQDGEGGLRLVPR